MKKTLCINQIIPYIIIGIISMFLFIRCFYSFSWSDESFYLTVAHRFWRGEKMIADEWYTTQLSTPILLPFYSLFQWITGGNEGVYLYFRLLYCAIATLTAIFIYLGLKRWNSIMASLLCAIIYLLYSRANIGGFSYYNVTLTMVVLATILIYGQFCEKKVSWVKEVAVGVLIAIAVVNTPFLVIPYVIIVAFLFINRNRRKYFKALLYSIVGTGVTAIVYMGYVFSKITLNDLIENIPHILNEPEIQSTNPFLAIPLIIARITWRYKYTIGIIFILAGYVLWKKIKKRSFSEKEKYSIIIINFLVFIINSILSTDMIGCVNFAGSIFMGLILLVNEKWENIDKNIVRVFGISGFSLMLGFSFSSDTGLDALTIGSVVIAMGLLLIIFKRLYELPGTYFLKGIVLTAVCVMLFQTAILRFFSVYRDAPLSELDTQITSGPAKYLYTTKEHAEQYNNLESAIKKYVRKNDKVFYSKWCFWSYLCTDNEYGVPSSWRMPVNSERLEEYYKLNPDKIPTCIFVLNPLYGNFESSLIQNNEKVDNPNENIMEGYLYDYICEENYEVIELECATIYRSRE